MSSLLLKSLHKLLAKLLPKLILPKLILPKLLPQLLVNLAHKMLHIPIIREMPRILEEN